MHLNLARATRVKDIVVTVVGVTRTDWPEGLKENRFELVEREDLCRRTTSVFRDAAGRPLSMGADGRAQHEEARDEVAPGSSGPKYMPPEEVMDHWEAEKTARTRRDSYAPWVVQKLLSDRPKKRSPTAPAAGPSSGGTAEWFQLGKGKYEYPFSMSLPLDLPPTVHADFGCVMYTLRVTLVRSGLLQSPVVVECEVTLVQTPSTTHLPSDCIQVQRTWESLLSYSICVDGASFPIGTSIPLQLSLMPLDKVRVCGLAFSLEERIDYYACERKVVRHEMPRKWSLLRVQAPDGGALLPLMATDMRAAYEASPLYPYLEAADHEEPTDEPWLAAFHAMGPWHLMVPLPVTMERQKLLNISCRHPRSNIAIQHILKITIRVESERKVAASPDAPLLGARGGAATPSSAPGTPPVSDARTTDIVVAVPLKLRHSKTSLEWVTLPSYTDAVVSSEPPPVSYIAAVTQADEYDRPPPFSRPY